MDLACCICVYARRGEPSDAETTIRGYAACIPHAGLVAQGIEWHSILKAVREAGPR